ncbi:MAG TPA: dephospho-CoA kinase [Acidobacteriaceae bacterium]|nr:dephospho-CoA kinase [Acidobacteriaceae bacterium]
MLHVGLTGGLGSGKSTVAALFAARGVHLLEADAIGRELMQPGQPVYDAILQHFSGAPVQPALMRTDGQLDRAALARYVFSTGRIDELSHIVQPPVVAEQERRAQEIFARDPGAIVMVESALIFEADRANTVPGLAKRFDQLVLVTAPDDVKIARYVHRVGQGRTLNAQERSTIEEDARRRLATQIPDTKKAPFCDHVIDNSGPRQNIESVVERIFRSWRP